MPLIILQKIQDLSEDILLQVSEALFYEKIHGTILQCTQSSEL